MHDFVALSAVTEKMSQPAGRRVVPRVRYWLVIHDPAQPVRDERGSEQETAVRDLVRCFARLAGGYSQVPSVRDGLHGEPAQRVQGGARTPGRCDAVAVAGWLAAIVS